ncbi:MAG TPA: hypothetical protein ENJ32_02945 [Crenotrichaceae bacterium]|nr:hypothetical protein [Crenotrichaceae bacterium]
MKSSTISLIVMTLVCVLCLTTQQARAVSNSCEYTGPLAPIKGELIDTVRVMTMNVWGQKEFKESDSKCQARLKTIGNNIAITSPRFNIVGLTEVHPDYVGITCDGSKLVDSIQSNGEYIGNKARWGHPETSAIAYDGGISLFSTTAYEWHPYEKHVHQYSPKHKSRTAMGFIFATIQLKSGIALDVYVTHIHSTTGTVPGTNCNQACKFKELQQLAYGIHERSANSGNPVLVMGDFNIGGPNPTADHCLGNKGYGDIMDVLRNPRDMWLEAHPHIAGSTHSDERIDFMFFLTDAYFTSSPYELTISNSETVKLIQWKMSGFSKNLIWHQGPFRVSDHFGIEATLEVRKRLGLPTAFTAID